MNAKRQIQALNRYDWGNKTPQQVAKYVGNKLDMLGYKVPKYMKEGKITQKQLDTQLDKIYNKLEKIQSKQEFSRLPKYEQNRIRNERRLEKAVIDYNVKVAKIRDEIEGSNKYSDKMKKYILGDFVSLNSRDKGFYNEKSSAQFIDITKLNYSSITNEIKRIKEASKGFTLDSFMKKINDSSQEDEFFNELLQSEVCADLNENEKSILRRNFNSLNAQQKSLMVKDRLSELKEKYMTNLDSNPELFDYEHSTQVFFNQIISGVDSYGKY